VKRGKTARAQGAALLRRRELLMLDHIEQGLAMARARIMALTDEDLLNPTSGGRIVTDPYSAWVFRQVGLAEASSAYKMLDATYSYHLEDVAAGRLPVPIGPTYDCPVHHCIGHKGLLTFDEMREHMAACVPAAHARGYAETDPWGRFVYLDRYHPSWRWKRSERGTGIVAERPGALVSVAELRLAKPPVIGEQVALFEALAS
jgi:hypothetical protein